MECFDAIYNETGNDDLKPFDRSDNSSHESFDRLFHDFNEMSTTASSEQSESCSDEVDSLSEDISATSSENMFEDFSEKVSETSSIKMSEVSEASPVDKTQAWIDESVKTHFAKMHHTFPNETSDSEISRSTTSSEEMIDAQFDNKRPETWSDKRPKLSIANFYKGSIEDFTQSNLYDIMHMIDPETKSQEARQKLVESKFYE